MGKEYTAKSFKSGNSVAIRMPAALGVEPEREWIVTQENGELHLRSKPLLPARLDVDKFWGKCSWLVHTPIPREDFEPRPSAAKAQD